MPGEPFIYSGLLLLMATVLLASAYADNRPKALKWVTAITGGFGFMAILIGVVMVLI